MDLNCIFFPIPQRQASLQQYQERIIWIPRNSTEITHIVEDTITQKSRQQFTSKFGIKRIQRSQIAKPLELLEIDHDIDTHCEKYLANILRPFESQQLDLSEMSEFPSAPLATSTPTCISNYTSKNFSFINSFISKPPVNLIPSKNFKPEKYQRDIESDGGFSQKNTLFEEKTCIPNSDFEEDFNDEYNINYQPQSQRSKFNSSFNTSSFIFNEQKEINQPNILNQPNNTDSIFKLQPDKSNDQTGIVASLLRSPNPYCSFIAIFFHSNAEDVISSYELVNHIRKDLRVNVISVEYPGYSFYQGSPNAEQILEDGLKTYDFLVNNMGISCDRIMVIGRSIGAGPATYLASKRKVSCLCLLSPFTTIRDIVKDKVGCFFSYLVSERFNNRENIKFVKCPTFISHGMADEMISYTHSQELQRNCGGECTLITPQNMSHNQLDFSSDFSLPFINFLLQNEIPYFSVSIKNPIIFPQYLFSQTNAISQKL